MSTTKNRIANLEAAHRALHARHEALMMICRCMLPLIKADPADIKQMSVISYDALSQHMDTHSFDDAFQQVARVSIDELFRPILAALPDDQN